MVYKARNYLAKMQPPIKYLASCIILEESMTRPSLNVQKAIDLSPNSAEANY